MSETIHSPENVSGQVEEKMETVSEKAGQAMHHIQEPSTEARRAAQQQFGQMRDAASEYLEQGRAQMQEMGQSLEQRIHEQPFRSVLMAVGLGFLVGMLWPRRR